MRDLAHFHFEDLIGDSFVVDGAPYMATRQNATLILVDVSRHPSDDERPSDVRQEAFSLLFVARDGEELPSATYWVRHPAFSRIALFLHETRRADMPHDRVYVTVFN